MNGIERLRDLAAAGEKATQGEWNHFGYSCANDAMSSVAYVEAGESSELVEATSGDNLTFIAKAANARQALSDVLELVEAVREWRMFQSEETEAAVMRTYDALTSADAQEVRE